jgi:hypothetical protein
MVNTGELATDAALREVAARCGVRVFPKVRLASALDLNRSGVSHDEFSYGLKAEFDFVVADSESGRPEFAVEFDEPHHLTDPITIARDRKKQAICARIGFPLLRIGAEFLQRREQYTLIGWLLEAWFLERTFNAAQERGEIDAGEPFMYFSCFEETPDGMRSFSLDGSAREAFVTAFRNGLVEGWPTPETVNTTPQSNPEFHEAYSILPLVDGRYVIGRARLRNFGWFAGLGAWELATDLAVADCGDKLRAFRAGKLTASGAEQLSALRARTKGWSRQGSLLSDV